MTGPEHYAEAERLLAGYYTKPSHVYVAQPAVTQEQIAMAHVHAMLAQTAAIRDAAYGEMSTAASDAWDAVLGEVTSQ